jgi:hypothetical protein
MENSGVKIIQSRFGSEFIQYKPLDWFWSDYYQYLYNFLKNGLSGEIKYTDDIIQNESVLQMLFQKYVPEVWFYINFQNMDVNGANNACLNGQLHVIMWLSKQDTYPNEIGTNNASFNNHLNILEFLKDNEIYPTKDGIYQASKNGHIDIIKFYKANKPKILNVKPAHIMINAGSNGYLDLVRYMLTTYVHNPINSTLLSEAIFLSMRDGDLLLLRRFLNPEFLVINGIINSKIKDIATSMVEFRNFVLPYYKVSSPLNKSKIGYIIAGIDKSLERKNLHILDYLSSLQIYPSLIVAVRMMQSSYDKQLYDYFNTIGYIKIFNYLNKYKISLIRIFDKLSKDGNMEHVNYLGDYIIYISIRPKQSQIDLAYNKGFHHVVEYFKDTFDMYPTD